MLAVLLIQLAPGPRLDLETRGCLQNNLWPAIDEPPEHEAQVGLIHMDLLVAGPYRGLIKGLFLPVDVKIPPEVKDLIGFGRALRSWEREKQTHSVPLSSLTSFSPIGVMAYSPVCMRRKRFVLTCCRRLTSQSEIFMGQPTVL